MTIELSTITRTGEDRSPSANDEIEPRMKTLLQPASDEIALPVVMGALADPVRVAIVRALAEQGETVCGTLELGVSKATRSSAGCAIGNIAPQASAAVREGRKRGIVGRRSFGVSTTIELRHA